MASRLTELPRRAVVTLFLVLSMGPLLVLAYFAISLASDAVRHRVTESLRVEASIAALYVRQEMLGLAEVDQSFARRPILINALSHPRHRDDLAVVRSQLVELSRVRAGIGTAFLARPDGRLIDIVPPTPAIVGKSFAFRDWYRGVTRTGGPYVSEAYQTQATNHVNVVGVAAIVRSRPTARSPGRPLAIIVLAYRLGAIQSIVTQFARQQRLGLTITDQRGTVLAAPRLPAGNALQTLAHDPLITAALAGHPGAGEHRRQGVDSLLAWAPVPGLRWTVLAALPSARAFADVAGLRRTVVIIAAVLAMALLAGMWLLNLNLCLRQVAQDEAREVARVDALTSLPNRRAWEESLPRELARARRDSKPITVAMIDLDNFKTFNDTHGHQAGDELLARAAEAWTAQLRETDLIARYGGEEFIVALPDCPPAEADHVLTRLRMQVPSQQTCSIGVAAWDHRETGKTLVARADAALYEAKRAGRNQVITA